VKSCVGRIDGGDPIPQNDPISTSTPGTYDFTVTAIDNAGNGTSVTHTYTIAAMGDFTDPVVTITTPEDGATYAQGETVMADYECFDGQSGVRFCSGTVDDGNPIDTSTPGTHDFTVVATDYGDNSTSVTHTYTVTGEPDTTDPDVTIQVPGNGATFTQGQTVIADYECTDGESGIASCVGPVPDGDPIDTSSLGSHDFTVTAFDNAGNTRAVTHTYTVTDVPDTTDPTVSIATPQNGASFTQGQTVIADYSCTDGQSGIASCVGPVPDGDPIDTSTVGGPFEFSVTATDVAGNTSTVSHFYAVTAASTKTCNGLTVTLEAIPGGGRFDGTQGDDVILGTPGPDVIYGLGGNDTICGEGGDDLILGGPGDDTLLGGDDNDKLRGAAGTDTLLGGAGSDRLLPEVGNDTVNGGAGSDIVDYLAGKGPVSVDLNAGTATYSPIGGSTWTHALVLIEKVDGTRYDDDLTGNWKRNVLRGKQGADTIIGLEGDDDLIGGTDEDQIHGREGDDLIKGQAGDDELVGETGADKLVGGNGNDTLLGDEDDDLLIGGLKTHLGTYVNVLDGGSGWDTCRWEAETISCEYR
jgi:Ca2+-binding RTX toxin-like protein